MTNNRNTLRKNYKPPHIKKIPVAFKLPRWMVERLREEDNQAATIEAALIKHLKLKPPKG